VQEDWVVLVSVDSDSLCSAGAGVVLVDGVVVEIGSKCFCSRISLGTQELVFSASESEDGGDRHRSLELLRFRFPKTSCRLQTAIVPVGST